MLRFQQNQTMKLQEKFEYILGTAQSDWSPDIVAAEISDAQPVPLGGHKVSLPFFVVLSIVWKSTSG